MIEIYRRREGKDRLIRTYETYEELFRWTCESNLKDFGYNPTDRTTARNCFDDHDWMFGDYIGNSRCRYICYEDDKLVTPDRLVGLRRDWIGRRRLNYRWLYWRSYNRAYRGNRRIRTTQERRWAHAWDDVEFAPRVRGRRTAHSLPNSWDDIRGHNDKSWKTQSKRRHQWKAS